MPFFQKYFNGVYGRSVLLLLAVLIPIMLVQAKIYSDRFETRRRAEEQANLQVARGVAETFDQFVKNILDQELTIGLILTSSIRPPHSAIQPIFRKIVNGHATIRDIGWTDPDGKVLYFSSSPTVGLDISNRAYFQEIISGREWSVSQLINSPVAEDPIFTINRGVRDDDGKLLGICVALVDPQRLGAIFSQNKGSNRSIVLIDNKGRGVFHEPWTDWTWEGRNLIVDFPEISAALNGHELIGTRVISIHKDEQIYGLTPIPRIGWVAGGSTPKAAAFAAIYAQLKRQAALFLIVLCLMK